MAKARGGGGRKGRSGGNNAGGFRVGGEATLPAGTSMGMGALRADTRGTIVNIERNTSGQRIATVAFNSGNRQRSTTVLLSDLKR